MLSLLLRFQVQIRERLSAGPIFKSFQNVILNCYHHVVLKIHLMLSSIKFIEGYVILHVFIPMIINPEVIQLSIFPFKRPHDRYNWNYY